ncbi:MAG: retron system putative HNH endonuclease [Cyanobacteriota bacterium]|jgi:uncharacterized protein (TIGR02646 family)
MRYLVRRKLNPDCLSKYNYATDAWRTRPENGFPQVPSEADRTQIWKALNAMQRNVCAYCEGRLETGSHIEHFAKRSSYRHLTFEWDNLFGSCSRDDCCGHYKDSSHSRYSNYSLQDLIKPDVDNPWDFLVFGSNRRVSVRDGLSPAERKKGQTTIDVLNLDSSFHIPERVSKYYLVRDILLLIEEEPCEEVISLVIDEVKAILPQLDTYSSAALQHVPSEIFQQATACP